MEGLVFSWCALNFLANQALVRLRAAEFSICRLSGITSMHERYYKHNVVLSVCDCWGIIGSTVQTDATSLLNRHLCACRGGLIVSTWGPRAQADALLPSPSCWARRYITRVMRSCSCMPQSQCRD